MTSNGAPDESHDLVEPEGVNAGSTLAERDRRPDGSVSAGDTGRLPPEPTPAESGEMAGAPGEDGRTPGQQTEAGEG